MIPSKTLSTFWNELEECYDGTQLRSLFAYLRFGVLGDSIVSWRGPCNIPKEHIVDGEDLRADAAICGSDMLHFIVECFQENLITAVCLQRLLASIALEACKTTGLYRQGDDIYLGERKLSISIATASPTSLLIHFAVNISNEGTPVPTLSLSDLGIDYPHFAHVVMTMFSAEYGSIVHATQKVRWVQ